MNDLTHFHSLTFETAFSDIVWLAARVSRLGEPYFLVPLVSEEERMRLAEIVRGIYDMSFRICRVEWMSDTASIHFYPLSLEQEPSKHTRKMMALRVVGVASMLLSCGFKVFL